MTFGYPIFKQIFAFFYLHAGKVFVQIGFFQFVCLIEEAVSKTTRLLLSPWCWNTTYEAGVTLGLLREWVGRRTGAVGPRHVSRGVRP